MRDLSLDDKRKSKKENERPLRRGDLAEARSFSLVPELSSPSEPHQSSSLMSFSSSSSQKVVVIGGGGE